MQTLTLDELYNLGNELSAKEGTIKATKAQVQNELARRYKEKVIALLGTKDEPFGTTKLFDGEYAVVSDQTKKVAWDNALLQSMAKELPNPEEYLDIEYSMKESRFKALPETQRNWFARARTVAPGSLKITIEKKDAQ